MKRSFYSKLSLCLLACFLLLGVIVLVLVWQLTREYQNEVEQKLHAELAEHIVRDRDLLKDGEIVEAGTHAELLSRNNYYSELVASEFQER